MISCEIPSVYIAVYGCVLNRNAKENLTQAKTIKQGGKLRQLTQMVSRSINFAKSSTHTQFVY